MSNDNTFPYVPTFWREHSGVFGLRWTLTNTNATIISALIGILITPTAAHLLLLITMLLYIYPFHSRSMRFFHDQLLTIAINSTSPLEVVIKFCMVLFAYKSRVPILRSLVFWTFFPGRISFGCSSNSCRIRTRRFNL